jgi:hypothetical protein
MFAWLLAGVAPAMALAPMVEAGVGLPELLHLGVGARVSPRWTVEVRYGNVVFNSLVGVGATGALFGDASAGPPRHALLVDGRLMVNPTLGRFQLTGGGETIGAAAFLHSGYAFQGDNGFLFRARVGALFYEDDGFAAGPNFTVAAGWSG